MKSCFLVRIGLFWVALVGWLSLPPTCSGQAFLQPLAAGPTSTEAGVVNEATLIIQELVAGTAMQIPENLLASAEGVAIVPHYVRGAFVIGVAGGRGVLAVRDANRNWQAPEFITIGGGSIGWQAGVQATDLVLVFRSPRSLNNMRTGKLTLGANASAAAGPIGRYASAATDASAQAEIFTYSKSRGLFAGVALDGASLQIDTLATQNYYQTRLGGPGVIPQSAISLVNELTRFSSTVPTVGPAEAAIPAGTLPGAATSLPETSLAPTAGTVINPLTGTIVVPPGGLAPLEAAVSSLLANVDAQWQAYLALPATWKNATELPTHQVYSTLTRYERVATNPQFAALRTLPAFEQALAELRSLAARSSQTHNLKLPPPPVIIEGDVSRGRY
ncbi:MAG: lipid-binding SYLF domain-containing protein [Planctomycetaceae bacterium]